MEKTRIADLEINYQDVLKSLVDLKEGIDATKQSTAGLTAEQKRLEEQGSKGSDQWNKNAKAIETNNIVLKGLTSEYQNNQKVLVSNVAAGNDSLGTLEKLQARNAELRVQLRGLNLDTEAGRLKQKEYIKEINSNTEKIRVNSDAYVQQKMNIGNYKSALDFLPPSLKGVSSGFQGATAAAKVFVANPVVLAITAIVGVITTLIAAFKKTEEGGDRIKKLFDQIGAVMSVITDRIENFSLGLFKVLSGDAKLKDLKGTFKGIGDEIKRDAEMAGKLADMMDALEDREIDMITISAERTAQIAKLREQAADQNTTAKEQISLLSEAKRLMDEEAKAQQSLVLTKIANELAMDNEADVLERINQLRKDGKQLSLEELGLSNSTNEDRKRANELIAQFIGLEESAAREGRRVTSTLSGLLKKQTEDQDAFNKMAEDKNINHLDKMVFDAQVSFDKEIEAFKAKSSLLRDSRLTSELETQQLIYDSRMANNENIFQAERAMMDAQMTAELNGVKKASAEEYLIKQKYAGYAKRLAQEEKDAKLNIYAGFSSSLAQLFGENTKVGRLAAVASATIDTYRGSVAAFAQTPGGIIIKSLAAAAAITSGFISVKKILSTKSGLPGDSSGATPSMTAPPVASVPGVQSSMSAFDPTSPGASMITAMNNTQNVLVLEDFQAVEANQIKVRMGGLL